MHYYYVLLLYENCFEVQYHYPSLGSVLQNLKLMSYDFIGWLVGLRNGDGKPMLSVIQTRTCCTVVAIWIWTTLKNLAPLLLTHVLSFKCSYIALKLLANFQWTRNRPVWSLNAFFFFFFFFFFADKLPPKHYPPFPANNVLSSSLWDKRGCMLSEGYNCSHCTSPSLWMTLCQQAFISMLSFPETMASCPDLASL